MKRLLDTLLPSKPSRKRRVLMMVGTISALTACTAAGTGQDSASAEPIKLNSAINNTLTVDIGDLGLPMVLSPTLLQQEQRKAQKLNDNAIRIESTVELLKDTAGHTWYVFSGSTPSGWDCSGLVVWFYEQLGVTLEHRASLQAKSGDVVDKPMVGDIVAFYYHGAKEAHHVGIYIGHGKFISAPRPGTSTAIERLADNQFTLDGSYMRYIRIIESKKYPSA